MEQISIDNPGAVINTMQVRIEQLESQLKAERESQLRRLPGAVEDTIKRLRLHGVILLQLGPTDDTLLREQAENAALSAALGQSWMLDHAPVSAEVKDAVRTAANNGMSRW